MSSEAVTATAPGKAAQGIWADFTAIRDELKAAKALVADMRARVAERPKPPAPARKPGKSAKPKT